MKMSFPCVFFSYSVTSGMLMIWDMCLMGYCKPTACVRLRLVHISKHLHGTSSATYYYCTTYSVAVVCGMTAASLLSM